MNERDISRVRDILTEAQRAVKFAADQIRADLDSDDKLAYAIIHCLGIVGEAASKVTPATQAQYPQIAWRKIVGMRNRIIHDYGNVDLNIV